MRLLSGTSHGIIDYVIVIFFLLGPRLTGFEGTPERLSYMLAAVQLLLSLFSRTPTSVLKFVSFPLHGAIELIIGLLLLVLPWMAAFAAGVHSRNFFLFMGLIILLVSAVTDYRGRGMSHGPSSR